MKILNNGKQTSSDLEFIVTCSACGFSAQVNDEEYKNLHTCPNCGAAKIYLFKDGRPQEKEKSLEDRMAEAYPNEYYHYGESEGSKSLTVDETRQLIKRTINEFKTSKESGYAISGTGDTIVLCLQDTPYIGKPSNNDYTVYVAKKYYEYATYECNNDDCDEEDDY